ncbi:hypothetical protein ES703_107240 [subsurface metagenome]
MSIGNQQIILLYHSLLNHPDYLFKLKWPEGYRCPKCMHENAWPVKEGTLFECTRCHYKASVTAGTIFDRTRTQLTKWFRAIWFVTSQKSGASALNLKKGLLLGSYETAWTWLHKLRRAMFRPGRERLSGVIEVDETYVGGEKPGKRVRGAEGKALVVISSQEDVNRIGRIRIQRVLDASGRSLEGAVQQAVEPGSVIRTDGWKGYNGIGLAWICS